MKKITYFGIGDISDKMYTQCYPVAAHLAEKNVALGFSDYSVEIWNRITLQREKVSEINQTEKLLSNN